MVAGVTRHLPHGRAASAIETALTSAAESILFLDASGFSPDFLTPFKSALDAYIQEEEAITASAAPNPETHLGYIDRLRDLDNVLAEALRCVVTERKKKTEDGEQKEERRN